MAKSPKQDDEIEIDEAAKRRGDAGLLRALRTPPKPHQPKSVKQKSAKPKE